MALSGQIDIDVVVSQGCRPIGKPFQATEVADNVILTIEHQLPLIFLRKVLERLSSEEQELLQNGLFIGRAIHHNQAGLGRGDFLIRNVIGIDKHKGSLSLSEDIHPDEVLQFHLRDSVTATEDLEMILSPQSLYEKAQGALLFSCNGRGTRLYNHPHGDIKTIQSILDGVPLGGFFCAGEIGPIGGQNFLHSNTASLVLFRETEEM